MVFRDGAQQVSQLAKEQNGKLLFQVLMVLHVALGKAVSWNVWRQALCALTKAFLCFFGVSNETGTHHKPPYPRSSPSPQSTRIVP